MSCPLIRIQNVSCRCDETPPIPFSVRLRVEDEVSEAWRKFVEIWTEPLGGQDCHEAFWRYLTHE